MHTLKERTLRFIHSWERHSKVRGFSSVSERVKGLRVILKHGVIVIVLFWLSYGGWGGRCAWAVKRERRGQAEMLHQDAYLKCS
jgi:hypothetical protein